MDFLNTIDILTHATLRHGCILWLGCCRMCAGLLSFHSHKAQTSLKGGHSWSMLLTCPCVLHVLACRHPLHGSLVKAVHNAGSRAARPNTSVSQSVSQVMPNGVQCPPHAKSCVSAKILHKAGSRVRVKCYFVCLTSAPCCCVTHGCTGQAMDCEDRRLWLGQSAGQHAGSQLWQQQERWRPLDKLVLVRVGSGQMHVQQGECCCSAYLLPVRPSMHTLLQRPGQP
jgi:hypothetical protein